MTVTAILCIYCGNPTGHTVREDATRRPTRRQEVCENCVVQDTNPATRHFTDNIVREQQQQDRAEGTVTLEEVVDELALEDDVFDQPIPPPPPPPPMPQVTTCICGCTNWRGRGTANMIVYNDDQNWLTYELDYTSDIQITCSECGAPYTGEHDWA